MNFRIFIAASLIILFCNHIVHAQSLPSYIPTNGLVGWWPFNGNANDESGNGKNGTVNGATPTTDRFGNNNAAFSFDGVNDYIQVTNTLLNGGYQSYSISYWFSKPSITAATQAVINDRSSLTSGYKYYSNFVSYVPGSGAQACGASQNISNLSCVYSTSNNQCNGTWQNIIITLDANTNQAKIYLNGVLEGNTTFNPNAWPTNTSSTYFGASPLASGDQQWLLGKLDDIGFWNRALSPSEVLQLYQNQSPCTLTSNFFPTDTLSGCGNLITLNAGNSGATYNWNTGATTQSINVNNSGLYRCTVSQGSTCTVTDSVYVLLPNALPTNLQTGLVGYWPFCGNANDESGNGNNGFINGATIDTDRFGKPQSSYDFDGLNDYIFLSNSTTLSSPITNITLSAWVKIDAFDTNFPPFGYASILSKSTNSSTCNYRLSVTSTDISFIYNGTNWRWTYAPNSIQFNRWIHLAVTFGQNGVTFYLDGASYGASSQAVYPQGLSMDLEFGRDQPGGTDYFNGKLDDIGIWNRSLSTAEVQQLYQNQSPCTLTLNFFSTDTLSGCGNLITLNAGNAVATYNWNTGATSQSINTNSSGWYRCTVSQGTTCSVTDSVYVLLPNALPGNLQTGLIGYWPFCGNANDESGNGYNGVVNGATLSTDRFGNSNQAFLFDGINDYINCGTSTALNGLTQFSSSAWISYSSIINSSRIIGREFSNNSTNGVAFALDNFNGNNNALKGVVRNGSNSLVNTSQIFQSNQLYHVAMVFNGNEPLNTNRIKLYVNGQLQNNVITGTIPNTLPINSFETWIGGCSPTPSDAPFNGKLDDIAIWNRALTPTEVQQLYQNQSPCTLTSNFFSTDTLSGCGNLITLNAGNSGATYNWNTGATTQTINVNTSGWYQCTVSQGTICSISDSLFVSLINAQIVQGDTTICAGQSVSLSSNVSESTSSSLPQTLQNGLVGWWPFNGNAHDESGNGRNGTVNGAILSNDRFGNNSSSYQFNGTSSYIQIPYTPSLTPTSGSVAAWIKVNGTFNNLQQILFGQSFGRPQLYANSSYRCGYLSSAATSWRSTSSTGLNDFATVCGSSALDDSEWHLVVGTYTSTGLSIYIDGNLEGSINTNLVQNQTITQPFYIGGFGPQAGNYQYFNGKIDDVAVWNRVLSSSEISCLLTNNTYLWSTGATDASITVTPTQTTTYYVTVSNGISSCMDSVTITVLPNTVYYSDTDGDSYGNALDSVSSCTGAPTGYVNNPSDCIDQNANAYPGATEICNSIDDNCDGQVDEGLAPVIGPISGPAVQCIPLAPGSASFSIAPVPGANNYFWTAPAGATITSGNTGTSVTIAWTNAGAHSGISGPLSVTVTGACGSLSSTQSVDLSLQISVPVTPSSISGPAKLCPGDTGIYTVSPVKRAQGYSWNLPTGLSVVSGTGTNIIRVTADNTFTGGPLSVRATNACGNGQERIKNLSLNLPPAPTSINGPATGLCLQQGVSYSVSPMSGMTGYNWTLPSGASLVSGAGTSSVVVNFDATFTSGNLSVTAQNACGSSAARTLTLTAAPGRPGVINGPVNLCPGATGVPYSVSTVSGTTNYNWSVFTGGIIATGAGTKNITVDVPLASSTGNNVVVSASNACGTGPTRALNGISIDNAFCARLSNTTANGNSISIYPNPSSGIIQLRAEGEVPVNMELYNLLGESLFNIPWKTELNLKELPNGIYMLRLQYTDGMRSVQRIELWR